MATGPKGNLIRSVKSYISRHYQIIWPALVGSVRGVAETQAQIRFKFPLCFQTL